MESMKPMSNFLLALGVVFIVYGVFQFFQKDSFTYMHGVDPEYLHAVIRSYIFVITGAVLLIAGYMLKKIHQSLHVELAYLSHKVEQLEIKK